mmetsp:Transcript_52358/g.106756  ORF Transcript_52358/g.106756 Transcript_52358/m.106756 type:complete len:139 (-) Transcript_52358:50-466(-)
MCPTFNFKYLVSAIFLLCLLSLPAAESSMKRRNPGNSRRQTSDSEMRMKRMECQKTTCAGLDFHEKTGCTYQCISEKCYTEIYAHDELEEGEVDEERARKFGMCFRKQFREEQEEKTARLRKEDADRRLQLAREKNQQ